MSASTKRGRAPGPASHCLPRAGQGRRRALADLPARRSLPVPPVPLSAWARGRPSASLSLPLSGGQKRGPARRPHARASWRSLGCAFWSRLLAGSGSLLPLSGTANAHQSRGHVLPLSLSGYSESGFVCARPVGQCPTQLRLHPGGRHCRARLKDNDTRIRPFAWIVCTRSTELGSDGQGP